MTRSRLPVHSGTVAAIFVNSLYWNKSFLAQFSTKLNIFFIKFWVYVDTKSHHLQRKKTIITIFKPCQCHSALQCYSDTIKELRKAFK